MIPTDWLTHRARTRPETIALRDAGGARLTYAELFARAAPVADRLREAARPCVVEIEPGIDHAIAIAAATLARIPFQTLRPGLPAAERADALSGLASPTVLDRESVGSAERPPPAGSAGPRERAPAGPEEILCRVLTSGTSGARRPVELTYGNHFCSAAASAFNLGLLADERWLCCMPVDHVGGLSILVRSLIYGTTAVVHDGFDADRVAAEMEDGITIVSLVATQLRRLVAVEAPVERPRLILVGGGPVPAELLAEALGRGATVVQTYGLTEACSQVCTLPVADAVRKQGSAGRPLLGTELRIDAGEILVRGPTVAPGAAAADGWLHTGDRGRLDDEGFLWVEGRIDDLIVSGGENVAPEEVERALLCHPAVAEAAAVGRPDPEWGSAVVAAVVPVDGASPSAEELIEHCRATLAPHKLPKAVEFVAELPRSATGKLLRRRLR